MEQNKTTQPKSETNALIQKNEQLNITAFVGPSVKRREIPMRPIPINELIETIKASTDLDSLTGQLRSIRVKDGDEQSEINKEQQNFKAVNFPYFTLGEFKNNYLVKLNFSRTKFIVLDADHLGERLNEIKESLKEDPKVFIVFTSPRGDGLKIICELAEYVTSIEAFDAAFELVASFFERRYKIIIDRVQAALPEPVTSHTIRTSMSIPITNYLISR